jgi:putative FmdB family regulatory protein
LPLYEYRCTSCGYSFEKIQKFSEEPLKSCPKCEGVLIRPVTAPALRFEGAGWYVNDYAGKGGAKAGEAAADKSAEGASKTEAGAKPASESKSDSSSTAAPAPAAPAAASTASAAPSSTSSSS